MLDWFILQTAAIALGFVLDFIIGDPYCLSRFHPICAIGNLIGWIDRHMRRENDDARNLRRGIITVVIVTFVSTAIPAAILILAWIIHPILYFVLSSIMCWQILAARQLARESTKVQRALEKGDTEGARYAVSMIVGRDTAVLDENGICRAAVETVAENASDGVIAPLFWMMLFGAVGGFFYKSINTMDSMLGYKNEKYLYFGRAAAKTDDFVNFIPSRLSALLMVIACPFCGLNARNSWRIFRRDRLKHDSPNSAQTESACAGALGVRLAGDAVYGGIVHKKEYIGDPEREIEPADIARTNRLMYVASLFMLIFALAIRLAVSVCL